MLTYASQDPLLEVTRSAPPTVSLRVNSPSRRRDRATELVYKGSDDREASVPGAYRVMGVDDASHPICLGF